MLNKVFLIGNVANEPEVRASQTGTYVANLRVATNTYIGKAEDGTRKEATDFHNVVVFGKQAEFVGNYVKKGRQVFVVGRLHTSSWDDTASGTRKFKTEIVADDLQALGQREQEVAAA
jgi:single-strand DNA-binding protein